jgi:hypothetical protein
LCEYTDSAWRRYIVCPKAARDTSKNPILVRIDLRELWKRVRSLEIFDGHTVIDRNTISIRTQNTRPFTRRVDEKKLYYMRALLAASCYSETSTLSPANKGVSSRWPAIGISPLTSVEIGHASRQSPELQSGVPASLIISTTTTNNVL